MVCPLTFILSPARLCHNGEEVSLPLWTRPPVLRGMENQGNWIISIVL